MAAAISLELTKVSNCFSSLAAKCHFTTLAPRELTDTGKPQCRTAVIGWMRQQKRNINSLVACQQVFQEQ